MEKISELLLQWYAVNQRDLPWRRHKNAYEIWVSEIMLQQTRVETVIPYYERFLRELPDLPALAAVEEDRLLKLWEGLGYYSRVRNMQKAAKICMEQYGGQLPKTTAELEKLPGIGHYTAGAIASIAYGEPVCAVDGNLGRVYARLFLLEDDMTTPAGRKKVEDLIREDLADDMGSMNQALMDIGAGICLPGEKAKCMLCPLQAHCQAFQQKRTAEFPIRKKQAARKKEEKTVLLCIENDRILLHRRPPQGLLAGMIEFILLDGMLPPDAFPGCIPLGNHRHIFTHLEWSLTGYCIHKPPKELPEGCFWAPLEHLFDTYSFPSAFKPYTLWLKKQLGS